MKRMCVWLLLKRLVWMLPCCQHCLVVFFFPHSKTNKDKRQRRRIFSFRFMASTSDFYHRHFSDGCLFSVHHSHQQVAWSRSKTGSSLSNWLLQQVEKGCLPFRKCFLWDLCPDKIKTGGFACLNLVANNINIQ